MCQGTVKLIIPTLVSHKKEAFKFKEVHKLLLVNPSEVGEGIDYEPWRGLRKRASDKMRWDEEGNKPDTLTVETLLYFAYCLQLTDLLSLKTWLLKSLEGEEDERASE
ncbi:hypothetical protein CB1_001792017 [Camelus ferus]|nr:hypothetical protein CB1_001792017 [Camelus ferus]